MIRVNKAVLFLCGFSLSVFGFFAVAEPLTKDSVQGKYTLNCHDVRMGADVRLIAGKALMLFRYSGAPARCVGRYMFDERIGLLTVRFRNCGDEGRVDAAINLKSYTVAMLRVASKVRVNAIVGGTAADGLTFTIKKVP